MLRVLFAVMIICVLSCLAVDLDAVMMDLALVEKGRWRVNSRKIRLLYLLLPLTWRIDPTQD